MEMKAIGLTMALTAVSLNSVAASSDKSKTTTNSSKPITQWTCADYLALQDDYQPYAIGWATAFSKSGKPEDSAFDVQGIETIRPTLLEFCNRNPQASLWDKIKAEVKKHT